MPPDESKGSQLDAIGSLDRRQLDNTVQIQGQKVARLESVSTLGFRLAVRQRFPAGTDLRGSVGWNHVLCSAKSLSRPVPKLGPFEIDHKSAA